MKREMLSYVSSYCSLCVCVFYLFIIYFDRLTVKRNAQTTPHVALFSSSLRSFLVKSVMNVSALFSLCYQDGFRGTYDEVVAYERSHGIEPGHEADTKEVAHTFALYQCVDGFRGSKEECIAHEKEANLPDPSEFDSGMAVAPPAPHLDRVLFRIYESEVMR